MGLQELRDSWEVWRRKINAEIGHGIVIDALNVVFNPSHSTLVSRNAQSAIDELDSKKINSNAVSAVGKTGQYGDLVGAPELATVATTGSYTDLTDKPSIPSAQVQSDWGQSNSSEVDFIKNKPSLATVATSGSYNDLSNKPSIPSAQVQSDWGQSNSSEVDFIKNKPTLGTASAKNSTNAVTQNSTDLVESGAVYTALTTKLSQGDTITLSNFISLESGMTVSESSIIKTNNHIHAQLKFSGNITSGANSNVTIGRINTAYRPSVRQLNPEFINKSTADSIWYYPCTASIDTAGYLTMFTGESNTTYGNNTYGWGLVFILDYDL